MYQINTDFISMYKCWFPNCPYTTDSRSKIDFHHVEPKELNPNSKRTIPLCKTHHALIFVENAKSGQHSIKTDDSLEIMGLFESTMGKSVQYKNNKGDVYYYFPSTGDIWSC